VPVVQNLPIQRIGPPVVVDPPDAPTPD
jgi:hypothetical protein